MRARRSKIVHILIIIMLLVIVVWLVPKPLPFRMFGQSEILTLLASLFVVSLFLERALEVFVITTRGPEAAELNQHIRENIILHKKLDKQPNHKVQRRLRKIEARLKGLRKKQTAYKLETRRLSLWSALTLGLLVSAVGIRTLGMLVEPEAISNLSDFQIVTFHLTDVLLTGGLLAGGSEGIHKLTNVYSTFMEAAANKTNVSEK